uniref:Putative ribonuclease H-like domain-containing protein n=1 Tax=Tanacetum cinerariifolium TaxID=118510 RepID=A0A6L2P4A3_TANCI|nr:putative ribonuclease H-like domain-containing protein [Tanacetum cinerariifolium]
MPPSLVHDRYKSGEGYHAVPPLYTGTFIPPKPALVFYDADTAHETVPTILNVEPSTVKPNKDLSQHVVPTAVLTRSRLVPLTAARPVTTADKGVIDSGCSRHMTWNISYLSDFEEINRGYVAFGRNKKGGKITGKGKIRSGKLDFDDVYFVKELKFNLFSILQMCDKKNIVLFKVTECIVLAFDFKLPDENHVLLRVPRENNMYNVDLKNIVPPGYLTCLFAKATLDESNLWHRRLGHINFKTMNKLVKGNIVRGSPSKAFENNHTCVACKKGLPLFCGMKGIKREYSVARTPQQNGIAKRKNRTLIKAARTMLADSLLPIPFWAKAVNTACYVQNRVLVTKPYNKTPYELLLGRTPSIGFMRPFGCPVTILKTLDPLGKFDGKVDEGFLVGYSNTDAAAFEVKEPESADHVSPRRVRDLRDEFEEFSDNNTKGVNATTTPVTTVGPNSTNSTNSFSAVGPSNNAVSLNFDLGGKSSFVDHSQYPDDPDMLALEDITYSDDEEDVGAEADFYNLETNITVSPIPTTRVHKDHPATQIIGDLFSTPQTRSMTRMVKEQVAMIEAIRSFLAYASFMGFMVYQMNVKSAFLYGTIEEEVYVFQPSGFEDPDYPDKVYKVVKSLYGLHQAPKAWYETLDNYLLENGFQRVKIDQTLFIKKQKGDILLVQKQDGIFISQDKYVAKILRKFGLIDGKSASTPIDTEKPLLKDHNGEDVDVDTYRSMIVTPKASHLYAVKRVFSDYAGASLDRKSITGGCQFLGCRLISWQCKKQTVVVTSSTETEYVAAASCCAHSKSVAGL